MGSVGVGRADLSRHCALHVERMSVISTALNINADEQQQQEGTSTLDIARAIHRASWKYNEGRTISDIPFFDNLNVAAQVLLADMAVAAEMIFDRYSHETQELQLWNVANVLFEIYTNKHPLSSEGYGDWDSAPADLKLFWHRVAEDCMTTYQDVKHKPRGEAWMDLSVSTQ